MRGGITIEGLLFAAAVVALVASAVIGVRALL